MLSGDLNHICFDRYDKVKIVLKEIMNSQYCACMNPTAGSFQITPRMQRHFVTFAVQMPAADIVRSIYVQASLIVWAPVMPNSAAMNKNCAIIWVKTLV